MAIRDKRQSLEETRDEWNSEITIVSVSYVQFSLTATRGKTTGPSPFSAMSTMKRGVLTQKRGQEPIAQHPSGHLAIGCWPRF